MLFSSDGFQYFLRPIYRTFIVLVFIIGVSVKLEGQNLIPDGSFELLNNDRCSAPDQSFDRSQFWYVLDATPDLFARNCAFDDKDFFFWDSSVESFDGNNFIGLWSRWNSNETYFTEGIATSLVQPLEEGKTYLLEMYIINQGGYQGLEDDVSGCSLTPTKHIDLYLSTDSIKVTNDFSNGTASTTVPIVASFDSEEVTGGKSDQWKKVTTCFTAQGGEHFIGIVLPLGTFGELPPCAAMANSGVFRSFYYYIDALSIEEVPENIEMQIETCSDKEFEVDLIELFNISFLSSATFEWEDGSEQSIRTLSQSGSYNIDAILNCGPLPLTLNANSISCESSYYVPNVFSPNSDGKNDRFGILFKEGVEKRDFLFRVFNQWGNLVFESQNPDNDWNGYFNNQLAESGLYVWVLSFESQILDETKRVAQTGSVLLLK